MTGEAPPSAFAFLVETPSGAAITPAVATATPGTEFSAGQNVITYRITLPSPVAGFEEREGTWHAVLALDDKGFRKYLGSLDNFPDKIEQARAHGLRYNLVVHSDSNLKMNARLYCKTAWGRARFYRAGASDAVRPSDRRAGARCEPKLNARTARPRC